MARGNLKSLHHLVTTMWLFTENTEHTFSCTTLVLENTRWAEIFIFTIILLKILDSFLHYMKQEC